MIELLYKQNDTIETMEFTWNGVKYYENGEYQIHFDEMGSVRVYPESLNPISLEITDEIECPKCKGNKRIFNPDISDYPYDCGNCTDGVIHKSTLVLFDKEAYDEGIRFKLLDRLKMLGLINMNRGLEWYREKLKEDTQQ